MTRRRLLIVLILLWMFVPICIGIFYTGNTADCQDALSRMMLVRSALMDYRDTFGRLPSRVTYLSSGEPAHSWRFLLAPFLDNIKRPYDLEHGPWRADEYSEWRQYPQSAFCPTASSSNTTFIAIAGPGTFFEMDGAVEDDLIAVIEKADFSLNWMAPTDFEYENMRIDDKSPAGSVFPGYGHQGFVVLFADGEIWCLRSSTRYDTLKLFFTNESARQFERHKLLAPYRHTSVFSN